MPIILMTCMFDQLLISHYWGFKDFFIYCMMTCAGRVAEVAVRVHVRGNLQSSSILVEWGGGYTVNSHYCGHSRDRELVSSIESVCKNGRLSQSNIYQKILMEFWLLSVLAGCP